MTSTLRSFITIIFILFFYNLTNAQPRIGKFINASIGIGFSDSYYIQDYGNQDELDVMGSGFYAHGEYVLGITKWFGVRPYAGLILTSIDENQDIQDQPQYKVTSNAFLFGGKIRLCAPIPWIAPFVEGGVGASIGSFESLTPATNFKKSSVLIHIPFSFGLALGPKNNIEIAATYYFHPSAKQYSGALAAGFTFPID